MTGSYPLGDFMTIPIKTNVFEVSCMFEESRDLCGPVSHKPPLSGDNTNHEGRVHSSSEVSDRQPGTQADAVELQRAADDGCPHHDD